MSAYDLLSKYLMQGGSAWIASSSLRAGSSQRREGPGLPHSRAVDRGFRLVWGEGSIFAKSEHSEGEVI